ncbi:MAG: bifunctional tetrahydrofolate synthase/dihydrofolate synthase [Billgrantia sp.]|uniref:Dihydrofolate synthase/folylpolyglutamate synthase n=1 Tax=Billgrantia desiderata TaxID=52021 RepID=A0ABS9B2H1_9GAMM|nr:bifunctional tetrahydrofolate synthase/dihydrofolate synthase [Halomonas desiderata]MCE8041707.1 bifunctional tetrahydrofolate synthase/dihydrofolate synthase [Halomonas desiderata]MCE8046282.1 bifunctional tetrahydrofolate synthase/dihydrofolate synthase [Halomonas desiderata]OUE45112.1 bifunctional tetrahydrofolate synthase/dihydrofolate synthase [Halomonas desiderata SP1]
MPATTPRTLDAWLEYLERVHPVGIDLGLDRVAEVARRMALLDEPLASRIITVAGTNGKGSTVAMIEALARAHGLSVAAYTSPHLLRYNERLRFDGNEADDAALIAGFEAVEAARLTEEPVSLTYFEAGTLAALWLIARRRPDLAVLEVGLGGRLDAVNVIDADVAVITTIALDHAAFLGNELEGIGREKAGIMRAGCPAVLGSRELPASVRQSARERGAPVNTLGTDFYWQAAAAEGCFDWQGTAPQGGILSLDGLPDPGLPLDNAATALQALAAAGIVLDERCCRAAMADVRVPGRMQWLGQWCLDVGHNPHAAGYLAGRLAAQSCRGRTWVLLGMLADKDADGVIEALGSVADEWVTATLGGERAREASELARRIEAHGGKVSYQAATPEIGAEWLAERLAADDRVLVCGSFFMVAAILTWKQAHAA